MEKCAKKVMACGATIGAGLAEVGHALVAVNDPLGKPIVYIGSTIFVCCVLAVIFPPVAIVLWLILRWVLCQLKRLVYIFRKIWRAGCFAWLVMRFVVQMIRLREPNVVGIQPYIGGCEVTLCPKDQPGLLAKVASVLFDLGIDIRCGIVFTSNGTAMGRIYCTLPERKYDRHAKTEQFIEDLRAVISTGILGDGPVFRQRIALEREDSRWQPHVSFEDSSTGTVVAISTRDHSGLVAQIGFVFSSVGLNIQTAIINTQDGLAIDFFQLPKISGVQKALVAKMLQMLL